MMVVMQFGSEVSTTRLPRGGTDFIPNSISTQMSIERAYWFEAEQSVPKPARKLTVCVTKLSPIEFTAE